MIETRQKNVKLMVTQVPNWRQMFTGIRYFELWDMYDVGRDYKEKLDALEALGTNVVLTG